jgi:hypothetical protein
MHLWAYNAGKINLVCNYNEIKRRTLLMRTVIQYHTTFYSSVCMWKAARLDLKFRFLAAIGENLCKATTGFLIYVLSVFCLSVSLRHREQSEQTSTGGIFVTFYIQDFKNFHHFQMLVKIG